MKAVVAVFNQEKALVGAFSVITNLRMELFEALVPSVLCCTDLVLQVLVQDVALAHLGLLPAHLHVLLGQARPHTHLDTV